MILYEKRIAAIKKYGPTLDKIAAQNKKENGDEYDPTVCFDMLIADLKAVNEGREIPFPFEGSEEFDYEEFAKVHDEL